MHYGRNDFTIYQYHCYLGYVALGECSTFHIPYNQQLYTSYVISTNVEKSHPCKKIKDGFTVLSVTSSVVEKSHPLISFNSLRPLRFGRGDHILLTDHQTLVILPIPHIPYIRQPYTSYVISTNAEKSHRVKN